MDGRSTARNPERGGGVQMDRGVHSMLTMKQLASLEKQGGGSWKRYALPECGGEEYAFFNGRSKVGGEVGGFCFITPGGDGRPCYQQFVLPAVRYRNGDPLYFVIEVANFCCSE